MRKTTINISEDFDADVEKLQKIIGEKEFTRTIQKAVSSQLRAAQSTGIYRPTYTLSNVYVEAENDVPDVETVQVVQDVEGGPFYYRLRRAKSIEELLPVAFYIEVKETDLVFPRAVYDFKEVKPAVDSDYWKIFSRIRNPKEWKPKYYQRAALVATPQLGLM